MDLHSKMEDHADEKILSELQRNAKARTGDIAKRTGVPTTTVHNRIKRMEREGVIRTYRPVLDYAKLGKGIHALIFITAEGKANGHPVDQEQLAKRLLALPGVDSSRIITGGFDLVLEARIGTMEELNILLTKEVRKVPGVDKTQTMFVLQEIERKS
jgi:DNA-binding Lrp family transcriptional regulator